MIGLRDLINSDKDILGGQVVFKGTRVPVETLFFHLEQGLDVEDFLQDFPSVSKEQALALLEAVARLLSSGNIEALHEASVG